MVRDRVALVVGPGPVTLQEGTCVQYMAARLCRYLHERGYRVVVLEDNPATLMDAWEEVEGIYVEPPLPEVVLQAAEKAGAASVWLGMAGRRGWELFKALAAEGAPERLGISVPDVDDRVLWLCGDRGLLRETLEERGFSNPAFRSVDSVHEGQRAAAELSFPLVVRPHFSCGGWGAGIAYNGEELPAVLEEALRESPAGEALVEESLAGYRKYVVVLLRDADGECRVAGTCEQLEPLPLHEEDAVLVVPPATADEGVYALHEAAREAADALGLVGVAEVKIAVSAGWEDLYVLDVNPRPWRTTPLVEVALGRDLLRTHLDLLLGGGHAAGSLASPQGPRGVIVSLPRFFYAEEEGEGCIHLRCRAVGRTILAGKTTEEAAAAALRYLVLEGRGKGWGEGWLRSTEGLLSALLHRPAAYRRRSGGTVAGGGFLPPRAGAPDVPEEAPAAGGVTGGRYEGTVEGCGDTGPGTVGGAQVESRMEALSGSPPSRGYPLCLVRRPAGAPGEGKRGIMVLGGDNGVPGGGHERNFAALRAALTAARNGIAASLYACDASFALLAVEAVDAVFLGPLSPGGVVEAVRGAAADALCCQFAGEEGLRCGVAVREGGEGVALLEQEVAAPEDTGLAQWAHRGVRTVPFAAGRGEARAFLKRCAFPVLADAAPPGGPARRRIIFSEEEGEGFLSRCGDDRVLLRQLSEEAQEVLVEAVAAHGEARALLIWEKLEDKGTASSEGLAVFPPLHLTSHQAEAAERLAREVISRLPWRGNLSMRMLIADGDALLLDITPGASRETPFLARASGLPLPEMGMEALLGKGEARLPAREDACAWRCPETPLGIIAAEDIIPEAGERSTGSRVVMAKNISLALAKLHVAQGILPRPGGRVFLSVADREKRRVVLLARELREAGYRLAATRGTARTLKAAGMPVKVVNKLQEGRPNALDLMRNGEIQLVINVPRGRKPKSDGFYIREDAARHGIPCITDMEVAMALVRGLRVCGAAGWDMDMCGTLLPGTCLAEGAGGK
ncbi:MAG: ATP-grasp domain-containing protein [Actinobacteria bacterium]|nr:ATP-grasp domain-containing protein [Actinomycetota bacterium]